MLTDEHTGLEAQQNFGLIFLIGFMGCGKTTLGRKLASKLGYAFIDLDEMFEQASGITIPEYFKVFGEEQFRLKESEILKKTFYPENAVVSTGGGLPCFFDHMDWINQHGKSIYIKLSPKVLAERLENGKDERPVLMDRKGSELVDFISAKLSEREVYYLHAKIIINGLNITPAKVIDVLSSH